MTWIGNLKTLPISEIQNFGEQLRLTIMAHEHSDSLDKAFAENRVIYKAWHLPGRISTSAGGGESVKGEKEIVGADILNVALDPIRFRNHKILTKNPKSGLAPLGVVPSSLLFSDFEKNTVFLDNRGTATALLPENLYAGFSAYNETVKFLLRGKPLEELEEGDEVLREQAKLMRAFVTRPIFFGKDDIQSETGAYNHIDKPGLHVRRIYSALDDSHNPLMESLSQKLADPFRSNAIFYQTFSQHSRNNPKAWNEMVVKYRFTGHMAGLHKNIRGWVPGLRSHDTIKSKLENSGKFSEEMAIQDAVFTIPLVGEAFERKEEKKGKGKHN